MSDSPQNNQNNSNNESERQPNPIPILNNPATLPSSRRTVSFPNSYFDSIYNPPVTAEGQEVHGYNETDNIDTSLHPIEEEIHQPSENEFLSFPRRIKKGTSPRFPKYHRSQSQYGTPHSLAWSALRYFNEGLSGGTPSSVHSEDIFQRNFMYEEPDVMSPGEGSMYSVIMDDGTLQRRRISLTSQYSRHNTANEQTALLGDQDNSDSDEEDTYKNNNINNRRYESKIEKFKAWFYEDFFTQNKKNIVKCAIAYFLASLFTFIPVLNEKTGLKEAQNSHLVASVAVFFNPAKTVGGMYEAVMFSLIGGLFASFICIGSMASAVWFDNNGLDIMGRIIGVIVWCGGSMFIVAFLRAKLNKPSFNGACSLANIIIFVIVTKEGSPDLVNFSMKKIIQVTEIIFFGICISFFVSIYIWPVSASKKLKVEIGQTLGSFRLLLKLLTKTFLIDDVNYTDESVQSAIKSYQATFTSLKESLKQASFEIHNRSMQKQLGLYKETIESLQRLAQYLGGLRSCCGLQWEFMKDDKNKTGSSSASLNEDFNELDAGDDNEEEEFVDLGNLLEIIRYVGPSMKSLAFTCKQTISHLQDQFTISSTFSKIPSFTLLHQSLKSALELFEKSQTKSFTKLYRKKTNYDNRPNEEVFLVYFFVFNLQEFARELAELVEIVDHIQKLDAIDQRRKASRRWWKFWLFFGYFTRDNSQDTLFNKHFDEKIKQKFPENTSNLFNTIQTPIPKTFTQKVAIKIWKSLTWFRQYEVKYAFKAAVSAAILVSPAFIDSTRDLFWKYRGEWACISMMVVMVPTVGGANLIGLYRACGTLFGSLLAWFIYTLFPENAIVMSIFGFFIALGCYYFILYSKYNRIGQFVLLTYNLVALYKFNLRDSDQQDLDIIDIARYRTIAVGTGIIWGVYVTTYWWPYEARAELRKGLSQLFINMSWLYNRLVAIYSVNRKFDDDNTESSDHTVNVSPSAREFIEMELFLQVSLLNLKELLSQTPNEPRMKGPFPVKTYSGILMGCQNILDKLLSMRIAVTKQEWYSSIRKDFIVPVSKERKDLVGNIVLYFYILAAALRLKTPLPPYLPPAEKARRRLVKKIRDLPVVKKRVIEGNEHYIVYYAYVLVMEDIIKELEKLGGIMKELFGCVGNDEFDDFFNTKREANFDDIIDENTSGVAGVANTSVPQPDDNVKNNTSSTHNTSSTYNTSSTHNTSSTNNNFDDEFGNFINSSRTTAVSQNDVNNDQSANS